MNQSEKLHKLARMLAERNFVNVGEEEQLAKMARDICYQFTRLFHRIWIQEWQKLLKEKEAEKEMTQE